MKNRQKYYCIAFAIAICAAFSVSAFAAIPDRLDGTDQNMATPVGAKSSDEIASYIETVGDHNTQLLEMNLGEINTTVTFSKYLSFDEFKDYMVQHSGEIVCLQARGTLEDGTRVSIFTRTDRGLDETEEILRRKALTQNFQFVGITGMEGRFSSEQLHGVLADSRTYLADTTGSNYSVQNTAVAMNESTPESDTFPKSLTWELEDLGLLG